MVMTPSQRKDNDMTRERVTAKHRLVNRLRVKEEQSFSGRSVIRWDKLNTLELRRVQEMFRHQRDFSFRKGFEKKEADLVALKGQ